MQFGDAIKLGFQRYAVFAGRSARWEFWYWELFVLVAQLVLAAVSDVLSGIFGLATLLPTLAVGARRLHDIGKSGWWQLLFLIPLIGWIVLVVFFVRRGDEGPNRFGDNPLPLSTAAA